MHLLLLTVHIRVPLCRVGVFSDSKILSKVLNPSCWIRKAKSIGHEIIYQIEIDCLGVPRVGGGVWGGVGGSDGNM